MWLLAWLVFFWMSTVLEIKSDSRDINYMVEPSNLHWIKSTLLQLHYTDSTCVIQSVPPMGYTGRGTITVTPSDTKICSRGDDSYSAAPCSLIKDKSKKPSNNAVHCTMAWRSQKFSICIFRLKSTYNVHGLFCFIYNVF